MNKALADIPVGNQISSSPPKEHWSPLTTNNFAQMTGRSSKGWKGYDYSHVLKPELKDKGYTLTVHHDNPHENVGDKRFYKKALVATVKHKGKKIGNSVGYLHDNGSLELATEFASHINPLHRGKGLGVSMYEGIMSHSKNALNGKQVVGGVHSSMASRVHSALAKKHGLDYAPVAQENDKPTGEYDDKFGAYNYALKSEELNKALADIPTGRKISAKEHSYSHVLSPEHIKQGYSLSVLNDNGKIFSTIKHNGKAVGNVYGSTHEPNMSDAEYNSKVPRGLSAFSSNVKYGPYSYTLKSENISQFIKNISDLVKTIKTILPDESTTSEPGYSYHITNSDNLHSIAETGLGTFKPWHGSEQDSWPDGATEKRNYFHSNIKGTLPFGGPKSAILRVNQQLHPVKQEAYTKDLYSRKTVHPDNIELLTEHGWHPIKKWSEDKIKPQIQLKFPFAKSLNKSEHTWRNKPILKDKDAQDLDQTTTAYALKLGDTKKAEEKAYNEYQRNHRLDAAAHHYKALGMALAKCNQNAAAHHRLAYQGHMQALGLNGLESPPRVIMERIRQMVDNEQFRFKAHPADIF